MFIKKKILNVNKIFKIVLIKYLLIKKIECYLQVAEKNKYNRIGSIQTTKEIINVNSLVQTPKQDVVTQVESIDSISQMESLMEKSMVSSEDPLTFKEVEHIHYLFLTKTHSLIFIKNYFTKIMVYIF